MRLFLLITGCFFYLAPVSAAFADNTAGQCAPNNPECGDTDAVYCGWLPPGIDQSVNPHISWPLDTPPNIEQPRYGDIKCSLIVPLCAGCHNKWTNAGPEGLIDLSNEAAVKMFADMISSDIEANQMPPAPSHPVDGQLQLMLRNWSQNGQPD